MDTIDPARRSANMRAIRGKDTRPELAVRRMLREAGFPGYRLHRRDLPGRPDIVYAGRRRLILVHGCFWHGHDCREGARRPKSRTGYWHPKIEGNRARDVKNLELLSTAGWGVMTIWECEIGNLTLPDRSRGVRRRKANLVHRPALNRRLLSGLTTDPANDRD